MNIFPIAKKINPFWKKVAQTLSEPCKKCGNPRLYSVFDSYITGDAPDCPVCSAVYLTVLPLIKFVFGRVNLSKEDAQTLMGDTLIRKSMLNVIRGVRHFGLRAPQPTAVPVVIVWNFTNKCNLNCIHCHQNSGESQERELTPDEALTLIEKLGDAGLSILTFSGGEPLVRPDIYKAVEHARDAGMLCTLASNGTLMTKDVIKKLKRAGITRVEIGLDGCRDETHDFLRNNPGSFSKTVQGIKNCVEEGFDEVCATMTLHEKNITELEGTVELAEELGVNRFYLNRLIPAGRGKEVIDLDVTKEEKIKALQYIYTKFYKSVTTGKGIQCYSRGMTYYGRLGYEQSNGTVFTVSEALSGYDKMWLEKFGDTISKIVQKYAPGFGGCSAGVTYAGLTAGGDLLPCVPAPIPLGNLLEEDLEDIWVNNELLTYMRRRDELSGTCGRCYYNSICGWFRYTAYAVNGDWLTGDPTCPFGPSTM